MDKNEDNKWHGWQLATVWSLVILIGVGFWITFLGAFISISGWHQ